MSAKMQEDKEMMMFVPEDRVKHTPQWWNSERYDYCDVIMEKDNANNLFKKIFVRFSQLFA